MVYLAKDLKHHRKLAVMVLRPEIVLGKRSAWTEHQCSLVIGRQIVAAHVRDQSHRATERSTPNNEKHT